MQLPTEYIIEKIYAYTARPTFKRHTNVYNFECPICHEGKSKGKKRRGFYYVTENYFQCWNCPDTWSAIQWLKRVTGLEYGEILNEAKNYHDSVETVINRFKKKQEPKKSNPNSLPYDSINLFDESQVAYYKDNSVVQDAIKYIKQRLLDTAINKPPGLYISLKDDVHKNRLCIPFADKNNKIKFYQTRAIYKKDEHPAKYLSKMNAEKTIFGIVNIDVNYEHLFIFEGPIDSMFVKNGIAIGGIVMSELQEQELDDFKFHKRIWVLDNPFMDTAANKKIHTLIDRGEDVFIYPTIMQNYKDINAMCVDLGRSYVPPELFIKNTMNGLSAKMALTR